MNSFVCGEHLSYSLTCLWQPFSKVSSSSPSLWVIFNYCFSLWYVCTDPIVTGVDCDCSLLHNGLHLCMRGALPQRLFIRAGQGLRMSLSRRLLRFSSLPRSTVTATQPRDDDCSEMQAISLDLWESTTRMHFSLER